MATQIVKDRAGKEWNLTLSPNLRSASNLVAVYVTKYAAKTGVLVVAVELSEVEGSNFLWAGWNGYKLGVDAFWTLEEAKVVAGQVVDRKIAALKAQVQKLETKRKAPGFPRVQVQ